MSAENHIYQKMRFRNPFLYLRKYRLSSWIIILIALISILRVLQLADYKNKQLIIQNDVLHYYAFLPAVLVYNDLQLNFVKKAPGEFSDRFWPVVAPNGNYVIMTTMGMSLMYAPFVIPVHYYLKLTGQEALGYSPPYKLALIISSLVYALLGLILIKKLLQPYFSDMAITLTLICTVLATNLFYYITREASVSHAYSFFLIIWLVYNTSEYYKKPTFLWAVVLGISAAMIALVRPTNMVAFILIPLWSIDSWKGFKERLGFLTREWKHLLAFILAFMLMWVPQVIYWKMTSGQLIFNGYGDGGRFFFGNPQFANILFSYRKGWLLYTPLMLFAIAGFYFLYTRNRKLFVPVFIFFIINTYILASWWLWWFGGSYGNRAFVDMYGLMAFPMAALFHYLLTHRKLLLKIIPFFLTIVFVAHNLFQTQQYMNGAIHFVSMTKEAYWESFGKLQPTQKYYDLLVFPDYILAKEGKYPKPVVKDKKDE